MFARKLLFTVLTLTATGAMAADPTAKPSVVDAKVCYENNLPSDAFGFTTGTDLSDQGASGVSLQYGGAFATRSGNYYGHGLQAQYAYGLLRCLEVGPFLYGSSARNGGILGAGSGTQFGGGIEIKYKFLGRDTHGIGGMLDVVAQGVSNSGSLFRPSKSSYDGSVGLFFDKVVIPGKLFAAMNIGYSWNWFDKVPGGYTPTSVFRVTGALSYQVQDGFYLGAELGHFRRYDSQFFARELGHATYLGPTFFWQQPGSNLAISGAYGYQLGGKAKGSGNRLDLTNFSQHTAKVKVAYSF